MKAQQFIATHPVLQTEEFGAFLAERDSKNVRTCDSLLLDNATTVAKVGFYLEQHTKQSMFEESSLFRLRERIPKTAHYLDRLVRGPGHLVESWNLIVPERILSRTWEEVL